MLFNMRYAIYSSRAAIEHAVCHGTHPEQLQNMWYAIYSSRAAIEQLQLTQLIPLLLQKLIPFLGYSSFFREEHFFYPEGRFSIAIPPSVRGDDPKRQRISSFSEEKSSPLLIFLKRGSMQESRSTILFREDDPYSQVRRSIYP